MQATETKDPKAHDSSPDSINQRPARWELVLVCAAVVISAVLGGANLDAPSLWHDELVHIFVGKSIAETGYPRLPGGVPYWNGTTHNFILAAVMRVWGTSEVTVRLPSVIVAAVNVLLAFFVMRRLLGRETALVVAFMMALSPWTVAWAREARPYALQQGLYLCTILSFWQLTETRQNRKRILWAALFVLAYALGLLTSYHSILFLSPVGLYALARVLAGRTVRSRQVLWVCLVGILVLATFAVYFALMNPLDRQAVFERGGLGGAMGQDGRAERMYYPLWLRRNHSTGFLILAFAGFAFMVFREGKRGLYTAMAFWVPILLLTFFIGYRRPRFMYFCFPFYLAACSYGAVVLVSWVRHAYTWRDRFARLMVLVSEGRLEVYRLKMTGRWVKSLAVVLYGLHRLRRLVMVSALVLLTVYGARMTLSAARLIGDSLETASGADVTLARRHPQWKKPCAYVREHGEGAAIVTTTYLPVLYYVGRVDNWYPTMYTWWEEDESGFKDLNTLDDFKRYVAQHPKGFYLAEWWRFDRNRAWMKEDVTWVEQNMTLIEEATSEDVQLYAWGFEEE